MTLDLGSIAKQIKHMSRELSANAIEAGDRLRGAVAALYAHSENYKQLCERINASKTCWPVARPLEPLASRCPAPNELAHYTIIATDGSQIEPDRHRAALCYVLNIGAVALHYGPQPYAILKSNPTLAFKDDDLHIVSDNRRFLVQGHILTVKRTIAEADALADMAEQLAGDAPMIGLQDGTLIMQTLEGWGIEDELRATLTKQFLGCLDRLRRLGVPLASYVSRPRAADVVNCLRVADCPHPTASCAQHCRDLVTAQGEPCAWLSPLTDRLLFEALLSDGERSGLFLSSSPISLQEYGEHKVHYFYINVGKEIARVEVPEWVARDAQKMLLVHSAVYDQCKRGNGYPRSLAEAHERAVIGATDREVFWRMVDTALVGEGLPTRTSQKERSKRIRGL